MGRAARSLTILHFQSTSDSNPHCSFSFESGSGASTQDVYELPIIAAGDGGFISICYGDNNKDFTWEDANTVVRAVFHDVAWTHMPNPNRRLTDNYNQFSFDGGAGMSFQPCHWGKYWCYYNGPGSSTFPL
jgi:hypothetical protein